MRERTMLFGALATTAGFVLLGVAPSWTEAQAEPRVRGAPPPDPPREDSARSAALREPRPNDHRPTRTIQIALFPENARIAVDGQLRDHPAGVLELKGPLGAVFTIEAMANGTRIVERVAVTDIGAFPSQIAVPVRESAMAPADCDTPFYYDARGLKHYKLHCLGPSALEPEPAPPPYLASTPPPPVVTGRAQLTVVCVPRCDSVVDNGTPLGPAPIVGRPVAPGKHVIELSAANGTKKQIVTEVAPDTPKEIRVSMDPEPSRSVPLPPASDPAGTPGFLSLAVYPWVRVTEGGRALCTTPCVKIPLSPGAHTLVLENAERGMHKDVVVTIRSGEITTKALSFE